MGLPWKEEEPKLPNNRKMALERLNGLKKRFQNDSEFFRQYCEKMDEYLQCKYAVSVKEDESVVQDHINYIPHHAVATASKFRVIFDCSAKF